MKATGGLVRDTVARSGNYISGRDKRADEVKTALGALRRDMDSISRGRTVHFSAENMTGGGTVYLLPWYSTAAGSATERWVLLPGGRIARNLYVWWATPGTGSGSVVLTVRRNGEDTSLSVTVPVEGTSGSNRSDAVRFEAGDRMSIKVTDIGTVTGSPDQLSAALEVM